MKHSQPPPGYRSWLAWTVYFSNCKSASRELRALMALLRAVSSARLRHVLPLDTYAAIDRCAALGLTRRRRR